MEPLKFRKIRSSLETDDTHRKNPGYAADWDTQESSANKRACPYLWVALFAGTVLFAVLGAALFREKMQAGTPHGQRFDPPVLTNSAEQETAQQEVKIALDCVATFFGSSNDLLKVAQCRPVPGLVEIFEGNKSDIALRARSAPSPGGNIKRNPPFIGIPITFTGLPPRTAWVEVRGTAARLDLESFVGHGTVPWPELEKTPAGTTVSLRGTLVPIDNSDMGMHLIGPDGKARIRIHGRKPEGLVSPRAARVSVVRRAETSLRSKGWTLVAFDGWEWCAGNPGAATSR